MKPLSSASASTLLERIDFAKDGELRSVTMNSPTTFSLRLSVQDGSRGYDWIDIIFEVSGVSDARLLEDTQLKMVDMSDGVSIVIENGAAALGIGSYETLENITNAPLYLCGSAVKYEEAPFSAS